MNSPPSNPLPNTAVKGHFERWPSTLNSPPLKTRPHTAVELPFSPGGAREGWGESGGCSARIATQLIATSSYLTRASGLKFIQRPVGTRLQKFLSLVLPPLSPNPSPPPPGRKGELNSRMWPTLCAGLSSIKTANIQTCRVPELCRWQRPPRPAQRPIDKVLRHFYTRPHTAVELPGPPGGAREGWGESGGCSAKIATQSIAT